MADTQRIMLVDDEPVVRSTLASFLVESGHEVDTFGDGEAALEALTTREYEAALVDLRLPGMSGLVLLGFMQAQDPDMPVVLITGHGSMETVIDALRSGAVDFLSKPIHLVELEAVLQRCFQIRQARRERGQRPLASQGAEQMGGEPPDGQTLIGPSAATNEVRRLLRQAVEARCDTVLITGETGVGKEVAAREFHRQMHGGSGPFIAVSCPAIPDSLVESELFGHVRGAFTGATTSRAGCFELADGGTLFLDEVGDLSPLAQAKLLRVLETRVVRRVGGARETPVQVHVLAATHSPLAERVKAGSFRRDLFYRLNLFAIHIEPLRQRPDDIMPLAEHFLRSFCQPRRKALDGFSPEAAKRLCEYAFPGNARELRNIVERAAILCREGMIRPTDLHLESTAALAPTPAAMAAAGDDVEACQLREALQVAKWNRRQAAKLLDMPYSTFRYKIKKHGLE